MTESTPVADEGDDPGGLTGYVLALRELIEDDVLTRIEALEETQNAEDGQARWAQWCWRYTSGEERRILWQEVADFVRFINARFGQHSNLLQIRPCWYEHPVVVEELTAMMVSWQAAMAGARKVNTDYSAWLSYWFYPRMAAIRESKNTWGLGKCLSEHHAPDSVTAPEDAPTDLLNEHIEADMTAHGTS